LSGTVLSVFAGLGSVADALRLTGAGSGRALDRDERPDPPLAVDAFESSDLS